MKTRFKNKVLIISIVILLLIIGLFNIEKIKGFLYLNCIKYDMEISYQSPSVIGGRICRKLLLL